MWSMVVTTWHRFGPPRFSESWSFCAAHFLWPNLCSDFRVEQLHDTTTAYLSSSLFFSSIFNDNKFYVSGIIKRKHNTYAGLCYYVCTIHIMLGWKLIWRKIQAAFPLRSQRVYGNMKNVPGAGVNRKGHFFYIWKENNILYLDWGFKLFKFRATQVHVVTFIFY
jgi:hypothetical protein